jgi:hypothetical protein
MIAVAAPLVSEAGDPASDTSEVETATHAPPLTPARAELAAAIQQLLAAQHEAELLAVPARRLADIIAEAVICSTVCPQLS